MKNINLVLLGCFVIYSSFASGIDLYIEKDGHSVRVDDGSVSIDTPDSKLRVGKKPAGSTGETSGSDSVADKLDPIMHASASDIEFTGVQQRDLEVTLGGAGSITISGKVENLIATINGSGNLELENLIADKAVVKINSSGTANINVRRELKAEIIGSGDIHYRGNPSRVIPKISGSGSIEKD